METSNIFEALHSYYERNKKKMPQQGLSSGIPIEFLVIIDKDGNYCRLEENSFLNSKKKAETIRYDNAPFDVQPTNGIKAHILYGNRKYFFPNEDGGNTDWNDAFQAEIRRVMDLCDDKSEMQSILRFYESGEFKKALEDMKSNSSIVKAVDDKKKEIEKKEKKLCDKSFDELLKEVTTIRFTFKFHGMKEGDKAIPILNPCYRDAFIQCYAEDQQKGNISGYGIDSITGEYGPLVRVFPKLSGSTFIGFNNDSSNSHGYEQMGNCPMSNDTAFKIASAFSYLYNSKKHSFFIGNNGSSYTLLFWSSTNSEKISDEELESDFLDGLCDFIVPNRKEENAEDSETKVDGQENEQAENLHKEKVYSSLKGESRRTEEMNSTYYVASIVRPTKGTVYVDSFKSGKIGELYGNLEKYERNFRLDDKGHFASPYSVLEACYRRDKDGEKIKDEDASKQHIHMRQELLMDAIFGLPYKEALFAEIIERIFKENRFEYNKTFVGKRVRYASVRAFAMQSHTLDDFKFEKDLENLPYQIGAFYGVCEAIRYYYNLVKGKDKANECWTIQTAEFRKGLVNQTTQFIIDKLTRDAKILADYLDSEKKKKLIGEYKKDEVWRTIELDDGRIVRKSSWEMTHPVLGELDWAIYRMKKLSDQKKSTWSLDDKAMYLLGFYRMYNSLIWKSNKKEADD